MFFLKKQRCDYVDCDEFGWWLNGSKPEPQIHEDVLTSDGISTADSTQSVLSCADPDDGNSFVIVQDSGVIADLNGQGDDRLRGPAVCQNTAEDDDSEEICFAEEPPCKTCSRSYTPERLVRTQDYTILSPSPTSSTTSQTELYNTVEGNCKNSNKRHRRLNHLIDKKLIGASHLQALLDPDALDIKIPVVIPRRKASKCRLLPKESSCSGDLLAIANSDSPKRPLTPDLMSSGSSCERLNSEWHRYDSLTITEDDSLRIEQFRELRKVFGTGSNSDENFLRDQISNEDSWRRDFGSEQTEEDPEIVVKQLRGRIDHIKDTNKDIFGDIYSLRKNFQWAETKTGHLTTETIKLRQEIRDLRYLDDLVNLLRGELERISQRNWPFNLGHTDHHTEEVNLVV